MVASPSNEAIVYRATNTVNGKGYIGYTGRTLRRRMRAHFSRAKTNFSPRSVFHAAIRKYGPEAFVFEQIASFGDDEELALLYEYELIDKELPEYNAQPGGAPLSHPATPEEASAKYGYWKGKVGNRKGAVISAKTRALQRAAKVGKVGSWAGKKRPEAAKWMRQNSRTKPRPVCCVDDGMIFESGQAADQFYEMSRGSANTAANKGRPTHGRRFEFVRPA